MIYSVYKVTFPNNKIYVGITSRSLKARKTEHKGAGSKSTSIFHKALKKYVDQETWEIIYQTKEKEDCFEKERYFIKLFKSQGRKTGYNLTGGGEGIIDYKFTPEQNKKNSDRGREYFCKNPEKKLETTKGLREFYKNNPDFSKERSKKQWESLEFRSWFGENLKTIYKRDGFKGGKKQFPIKLIKENVEFIFISVAEAAKFLNCGKSAISNVLHGRSKTTHGYSVVKV